MLKAKNIKFKIITTLMLTMFMFNIIAPLVSFADYEVSVTQNEIKQYYTNTNNRVDVLFSDKYYLDLSNYKVVSTIPAGGYFHLDFPFRMFLISIAGIDNVKDLQIMGGTVEIPEDDDVAKGFINETIQFYNDYGKKYADPKDEDAKDYMDYLQSNSGGSAKLEYKYYSELQTLKNTASRDTIVKNMVNYAEAIETPIANYFKKIDGKDKSEDEETEETEVGKSTKEYISRGGLVADEDEAERQQNSLYELTYGDTDVGGYDDPQLELSSSETIQDYTEPGKNSYGFRYLGRRAVIAVGNTIVSVFDGFFNLAQGLLLPGTPKAVRKRVYTDEIKQMADDNIKYGYYYSFYKSGDSFLGFFNKLPVYVDFSLRHNYDTDDENLQLKHPEWFANYSRQPIPMIMLGPYTILSNAIPLFNVNFFNTSETSQNPILEFSNKQDYIDYMVSAQIGENAILDDGSYDSTVVEKLTQEYSKYYDDAVSGNSNVINGTTSNFLGKYISKWYVSIRNICILLLLITLAYTGIRIIISNTSDKVAKYKQMLFDWIVAVGIVMTIHVIMVLMVNVANILTASVGDPTLFNSYGGDVTINQIRYHINEMAVRGELNDYIGYIIIYIFFAFFTVRLIVIMMKRVFYMGLLTILAPFVGLSYSIDKISDGSSQAFDYWFKEYMFTLLEMPVYCLVYIVLINIASNVANNPIFVLVCLLSINKMIEIIKYIFGIKLDDSGKFKITSTLKNLLFANLLQSGANSLRARSKKRTKANNKAREQLDKEKMPVFRVIMSGGAQVAQNTAKKKVVGFKTTIKKNLTKQKIKNKVTQMGSNLKFQGKRLAKSALKATPRVVGKGVKYAASGAVGAALGSSALAAGIVAGDLDSALTNMLTLGIGGYTGTRNLLQNTYDSAKYKYQTLKTEKQLYEYQKQILETSENMSDEQSEQTEQQGTNTLPEQNNEQSLEQPQGPQTSEEWFQDKEVQRQLARTMSKQAIQNNKEELKTLYMAGVDVDDMRNGVKFMRENNQLDKDVSAAMFAEQKAIDKDFEDIYNPNGTRRFTPNSELHNDTLEQRIEDRAMEIKLKRQNERFITNTTTTNVTENTTTSTTQINKEITESEVQSTSPSQRAQDEINKKTQEIGRKVKEAEDKMETIANKVETDTRQIEKRQDEMESFEEKAKTQTFKKQETINQNKQEDQRRERNEQTHQFKKSADREIGRAKRKENVDENLQTLPANSELAKENGSKNEVKTKKDNASKKTKDKGKSNNKNKK